MTSLFARIGPSEARLAPSLPASSSGWTTSTALGERRKRREWMCRECQARATLQGQRRRSYSDDAASSEDKTFKLWRTSHEHPLRKRMSRIGNMPLPPVIKKTGDRVSRTRGDTVGPDSAGSERIPKPEFRRTSGVSSTRRVKIPVGASADIPADTSASTPAKTPADTPANTPADTPANTPADTPADTSADPPAGAVPYFPAGVLPDAPTTPERAMKLITHALSSLRSIRKDGNYEELSDVDYAALLQRALKENAPDLALRSFLAAAAAYAPNFFHHISHDEFLQVVRLARPSSLLSQKLLSVHTALSPHGQHLMNVAPLPEVTYDFYKVLRAVTQIRAAVGRPATLEEYKLLLESARRLGSFAWADEIWNNMHRGGQKPDLECHNLYMAAIVWNRKSGLSQQKKRVTTFNMSARQVENPGPAFSDYRVGPDGVLERVTAVFGALLKKGLKPDESSFCHFITAAAREGDTTTINSLMRRAYNVDVDAVMKGNQTRIKLPHDSFQPTYLSLFALAHAFSTNNDMPKALRIVDLFARDFDLGISSEVWTELLQWTFVLAIRRTGTQSRTSGATKGNLPEQSIVKLWTTLTSPPYNARPTMFMYNLLMSNLKDRHNPPLMLKYMHEGKELAMKNRDAASRAFERLRAAANGQSDSSENTTDDSTLESLRRDWELADLVRQQDRNYLARWLRLILDSMESYVRIDYHGDWSLREIPLLLWRWQQLAPRQASYEVPGGIVSLKIRDELHIVRNRRGKNVRQARIDRTLNKVPLIVGEDWMGRRTSHAGH